MDAAPAVNLDRTLRLALLSALADPPGTSGASAGERPAFRRFAGKSVLAHQLDCVAHLECERVFCQVAASGPDLAAAKAHAERIGLRFEPVQSALRLQAMVTAADEIILIEDGILPDQRLMVENLRNQPAVLAFPEDPAVSLGFERLDATRAWSGALRTRGDSLARLADLPPDCALAPSLLRIALQTGARVVELDPAALTDGTWQRRVDRHAVLETEQRWVARQVRLASFAAPGRALVERIGLRWAQDIGGGRWARAPHGVALVAGTLSALTGVTGWPVAALVLLFVASIALAVARIFERVEALGAPRRKPGRVFGIAGLLRDGLLAALLAMPIMVVPSWLGAVLPLILVGVLWLGEASGSERVKELCGDRILLIAILIPLAYFGLSTIAATAMILSLLGALLWTARPNRTGLTAD